MDGLLRVPPVKRAFAEPAAPDYERLYRRALAWLRDIHGVNDWDEAADRYRALVAEAVRFRVAQYSGSRYSFQPGHADQASPELLDVLAGEKVLNTSLERDL